MVLFKGKWVRIFMTTPLGLPSTQKHKNEKMTRLSILFWLSACE